MTERNETKMRDCNYKLIIQIEQRILSRERCNQRIVKN
jgi:hypothetical protein